METIYLIIAIIAGIAIGFAAGFVFARLTAGKENVSRKNFDSLQKDFESEKVKLQVAEQEHLRLQTEIKEKQNRIDDFNLQLQNLAAEAATLKTKCDIAIDTAKNTEQKLIQTNEKTEAIQQQYFSIQKEKSQLTASLDSVQSRNTELLKETEKLKQQFQEQNSMLTKTKESLMSFQEQNKNLQEKLNTQKEELENIGQKFTKEFQILADQILEQKSIKFAEQNQANLKTILDPLGKNIEEFKRKVEETYDKESKERFSLAEKVKELSDLNQKISQEAQNLTQALKGSVKQQGNWGEMLLESILQNSGLRRDYEYVVQSFIRDTAGETIKDEEGRKLQPDVIVNLPDDRQIVIDSKVSLVAYDRYVAATDKQQQTIALAEHVKSIKAHIDGLSSKNYQTHVKSLDFVMLFVPLEPAYIIAMQHDTGLWEYAYKKRILLISPTNLIAALKLVADLWQREQQNKNAMKIAERGAQLYEKFVGFVESLEDIGKKIEGANKSYEQAMSQLSTGRGNLIRQVEMLNELGVKAQKAIPPHLLDDEE